MQCFLLPGKALGPFRLGATLRECISELQLNSRDFKQINTIFNIDDETKDDIVLDIKACGIYLRFDAIQQRLKLIDVYDLTKISIFYHKQLLTAPPSESTTPASSSTSSPHDPSSPAANQEDNASGSKQNESARSKPVEPAQSPNENTFARS